MNAYSRGKLPTILDFGGARRFKRIPKRAQLEKRYRKRCSQRRHCKPLGAEELNRQLGNPFRNVELLRAALTHPSSHVEGLHPDKGDPQHQRRLALLGEHVLTLILSIYFYEKYPNNEEGDLTILRGQINNLSGLADLARQISLGKFIIVSGIPFGAKGPKEASILAHSFQALLGALFRDRGFEFTQSFVIDQLEEYFATNKPKGLIINYKTKLVNLVKHRFGFYPIFVVVNFTGPDHDCQWKMGVVIQGNLYGTGMGKTKREATQVASKEVLEKLKQEGKE